MHTKGRDRHWLEIIHHARQVSAGLLNGRSERTGAVWGATAMQLCYVVPSQPQDDDMVNVAAVLSRWHLVVLHEDGSGEFWRARVSDLALRSEGRFELGKLSFPLLLLANKSLAVLHRLRQSACLLLAWPPMAGFLCRCLVVASSVPVPDCTPTWGAQHSGTCLRELKARLDLQQTPAPCLAGPDLIQ